MKLVATGAWLLMVLAASGKKIEIVRPSFFKREVDEKNPWPRRSPTDSSLLGTRGNFTFLTSKF